jgi:tripartite-type tricarboxylate transporter receptor subunit TctC
MINHIRNGIVLLIAICSSAAIAQSGALSATDFPTRPIRLIAPFAAGGSTDVLARAIAPELSKRLGQQVIVENRTGAGGNIGIDAVAKSAPDGYTIGMASPGPIVVNITLISSLPYDPIKDLAPIAMVADLPIVLIANSSVQANNVKELIALERANPGKLSFASAGSGTTMHLSGELFNAMAGTKLVHVPYRGAGAAITDILGGQIQLGFLDLPSVAAHVKGGRIKLLAVGNNKRAQSAPDLPTIAESGIADYETSGWFGVVAPARTPAAIIARLNAEIVNVMNTPSVRDYLQQQGIEPRTSTPEQFRAFIKSEIPKWAEVIRFAGVKVN